MTLFHACLPDLYSYFEEEEVNIREWAASALRHLLSRELTVENTLRLWDTYFAQREAKDTDKGGGGEWTGLNTCVCLALLKQLKEEFEEWEQSEIYSTLMKLPALDMDPVRQSDISQSFTFKIKERRRTREDAQKNEADMLSFFSLS